MLSLLAHALCAIVLPAVLSGCFASTAKLRVGPVVDLDGKVAVQSDLSFGFGVALSTKSAVTASLGVGGGSGSYLELTDTVEYHRLEKDHAWRAGFEADIGFFGNTGVTSWAQGALSVPLRDRENYSAGPEKGGFFESGTTRSRWSLGCEGRVGYRSRLTDEQLQARSPALALAATLEWHGLSRVH